MSAAVPWIGMLTATRSAAERIWPFLLVSSGTGRRRPNIVSHDAGAPRVLERLVDEPAHPREAGEVGVDELLRRLLRHADVLGQRERRLAVEQRVVDDLRPPPQLVRGRAPLSAPNTFSAVWSWMSSPRAKAAMSVSSPDRCASTRSSICE